MQGPPDPSFPGEVRELDLQGTRLQFELAPWLGLHHAKALPQCYEAFVVCVGTRTLNIRSRRLKTLNSKILPRSFTT